VAASRARRCVATRAMATGALGEQQDDKQQDHDEGDDPEYLHPARCAGVGRQINDLRRSRGFHSQQQFTIQYVCIKSECIDIVVMYTAIVPRLWNETIEAHRREVRDATLDTTAALVAEHGLLSVTMSQIAEETGIGRATLYKYFSSVEAILVAWHDRQVTRHLEHLAEVRDQADDAGEGLEAVLEAYALIAYEHHGTELAAFVHRGEHFGRAQQRLSDLVRDLLIKAAETRNVRDDVAPDELASYCLHALAAASRLRSKAAVRRLVTVILAGLHRREIVG
jgi:AcrR family transcriptional regulator